VKDREQLEFEQSAPLVAAVPGVSLCMLRDGPSQRSCTAALLAVTLWPLNDVLVESSGIIEMRYAVDRSLRRIITTSEIWIQIS